MSGGSLGYLYCKDAPELMEHIEELEEVERYLIKRNYLDIAADVRRLIEYCLTARIRIDVLAGNLRDVFHAVEWTISADYGDDDLIKHLEKYRKGSKKNETENQT